MKKTGRTRQQWTADAAADPSNNRVAGAFDPSSWRASVCR
jgi:hypothetical protein